MPREIPKSIRRQRADWWRAFVIYTILHYTLGGVATISVALVSLTEKAPEIVRNHVGLFGITSVICTGLMTFGRVKESSVAFLKAYRRLNNACIRFENDDAFAMSELLKAHEEGEGLLEDSDALT